MGGAKEAREALGAGLALAGAAWRDAWAPLAVSAAGWTAVFAAGRIGMPPDSAAALAWTGLALLLLMAPSKLGALHRLAAGADARDPLGAGGLQWTAVEARLAATVTALAAFALILFAVGGVAAVALLTALRPMGRTDFGPLGPLAVGFVLVSPLLLAALVSMISAVGRLAVTLAADAAEPGARFARGWLLTRGAGAAPGAVWLLTSVLPVAGLLAAGTALDALGAGAGGGRWSAPDAVLAGAVLAVLSQFGFAPLNAGALAQLRRAGLAREAPRAVDTAGALADKAVDARPAASPPELLAT